MANIRTEDLSLILVLMISELACPIIVLDLLTKQNLKQLKNLINRGFSNQTEWY